mgnify:CR=1 FL=1
MSTKLAALLEEVRKTATPEQIEELEYYVNMYDEDFDEVILSMQYNSSLSDIVNCYIAYGLL